MRVLSSAIIGGLFLATTAGAQEVTPPPIRAFPIATIEALGREIYRQDTAAWVATDAITPLMQDFSKAHVVGWIVTPNGDGERVRFLRETGQGLEAYYDIDVDAQFHTRVFQAPDPHLTADEIAAFNARQTAGRDLPTVCRPGYNSVVAKDPEGDGWLVWMLAPTPASGTIPVGGHYRFTISRDGKTVAQRDALSASCMVMDPKQGIPKGSKPAGVFVTHIVSPTPVETHVFLQIQAKLPMFVVAAGEIWKIDGGHITDQGKVGAPKS